MVFNDDAPRRTASSTHRGRVRGRTLTIAALAFVVIAIPVSSKLSLASADSEVAAGVSAQATTSAPSAPAESEQGSRPDQTDQEKATREKAAKEKAAQEKAAQEKAAQQKAAQETAAQEKAAHEKAAREKADRDMAIQDETTHEKDGREKPEWDKNGKEPRYAASPEQIRAAEMEAERALSDLKKIQADPSSSPEDKQMAMHRYKVAAQRVCDLKYGDFGGHNKELILEAKARLAAAQETYCRLLKSPDATDLDRERARRDVEQAKLALSQAYGK